MTDIAEIEEGLAPQTLQELRATDIVPGRPVIAVDVDDTLVYFVDHLGRWMRTRGFEMRLNSYELEGSMFPTGSDQPLPFDACIALINDFFAAETEAQEPIAGGRESLEALADQAQIVILTNVPRHAATARQANLNALGLRYPLVINSGGKGRALAWLAARANAQVALVDDSSTQLESVAKHLPGSVRIHFAGAAHIQRLFPGCTHATEQVHDWATCEQRLRQHLRIGPAG